MSVGMGSPDDNKTTPFHVGAAVSFPRVHKDVLWLLLRWLLRLICGRPVLAGRCKIPEPDWSVDGARDGCAVGCWRRSFEIGALLSPREHRITDPLQRGRQWVPRKDESRDVAATLKSGSHRYVSGSRFLRCGSVDWRHYNKFATIVRGNTANDQVKSKSDKS